MDNNQNRNPYNDASYRNSTYNNSYGTGNPYDNPYGNNADNPYANPYQTKDTFYGAKADERVNSILTKSFLYMFIALCLSAIAAETVNYCVRFGIISFYSFYSIILAAAVAELVFVFIGNAVLSKGNVKVGGVLLTIYSILNGITLSTVLLAYGMGTVTAAFISSALVFGVMSFIGIVSKKDFGTWGRVGLMLLCGIIVITVLNLFVFKSGMLDMAVSVVGLVIFTGLTAYDTQKIRKMAMTYAGGENTDTVIAMSGALQLYLDFINIFLYIIRIFGRRSK